jgi:hypothetical protein
MTIQRDMSTGLVAGSTGLGFLQYKGTTVVAGTLNGSTTAPTNTTRLNYEGNFYAKTFYGDGTGLTGTAASLTAGNATAVADGAISSLAKISSSLYGTSGANKLVQFDAVGVTPGVDIKRAFTTQQSVKSGTLTDTTTINWDGDTNGQVVSVTLAGNRTMAAPTNIVQYGMYLMRVTQDATGSRTLVWNGSFKFGGSGAPTLTTVANKTDWLSFVGGTGNTLEYLGIRKDAV